MKQDIQNRIQQEREKGGRTQYRGLNLGDKVSPRHPFKVYTIVEFPKLVWERTTHFVFAIADDGSILKSDTKNLIKITNEMATQNSKFNEIMLDLACKSKRDREWWIMSNLSGPYNKDTRQLFVEFLTGEKRPKAECGITRVSEVVEENLERFTTIVENEEEE